MAFIPGALSTFKDTDVSGSLGAVALAFYYELKTNSLGLVGNNFYLFSLVLDPATELASNSAINLDE